MDTKTYYTSVTDHFHKHYKKRLTGTKLIENRPFENCQSFIVASTDVKAGCEPRLYLHASPKDQVIILSHGLSDSPYYMTAIAQCFFEAGANVIIPLLPAHGLKEPDKAMEDFKMDMKWRMEIDAMVALAHELGTVVSMGGFSAGGALSYNKILRDEGLINGALFLFASAIDVPLANEAARIKFLGGLVKLVDGEIVGYGRNPYKYPKFPQYGAFELGEIINENNRLSDDRVISQPVFIAHSIHDKAAKLSAVVDLLEEHVKVGVLYAISQKLLHGDLPLKDDIPADPNYTEGTIGIANPEFDLMMEACMGFYKKYVLDKGRDVEKAIV